MAPLFSIETTQVTLSWRPRRARPAAGAPAEMPLSLQVAPLRAGTTVDVQRAADGGGLREQTDYTLFLQSRTGAPVALRHHDPVLLGGLHRADDGRAVHGTINFGTRVGRSRFVVTVAGEPHLAFEVEVLPSKLDYRADYAALRADLQEVAAELVLAYLRTTYHVGEGAPAVSPGVLGWAVLLEHVMDDLEAALRYVGTRPGWGTQQTPGPHRAERIRRVDAGVRRAVARGGGSGPWMQAEGAALRGRLPAPRTRYTLDTPEHRWLAARLAAFRARLTVLLGAEERLWPGPRRARVIEALRTLRRRVVRLQRQHPLPAAQGVGPPEASLRLRTAPGYREAYRACLALQQGLHPGPHLGAAGPDGAPRLGVRDLHLLYEYWCFLTLVRLVAAHTGRPLPAARLLRVQRRGLHLALRKGRRQALRFDLPGGRRLSLVFNPRFGGKGYLVPQQPDILLTLHAADGTQARYILDAKYRLDASPAYVARYGAPGPPPDALNTLHRYRDAIRDRAAPGRRVVQAVALFPYREPAPGTFAASRHHRALAEVGVGALPLLPGATGYLEAWLERVMSAGNG